MEKYHGVTAEGIVESALDKVKIIEDLGYDNLVISIKSSDVMMCAKAHQLIADKTDHRYVRIRYMSALQNQERCLQGISNLPSDWD